MFEEFPPLPYKIQFMEGVENLISIHVSSRIIDCDLSDLIRVSDSSGKIKEQKL